MNDSADSVTSRLLKRRAKALREHLPKAAAGDDRGVHRARVATRRLREALPILAAEPKAGPTGKARRKIRRLTRALGTVRELDVALAMLDELARTEHLPRLAVEEVRTHVLAERDGSREQMRHRLDRVDGDKLNRRLASVAEHLATSTDQTWRTVLSARLLARATRLSDAIEQAGQLYAPERLHAVRIATKKLRYVLELAAETGAAGAAPRVRVLKRAQELLGGLNDLHVLLQHVATVQAAPRTTRRGLESGLAALASHLEGECRHLHGRYLTTAPKLREVCAAVPREIVPAIERRSRRPLKMALVPGGTRRAVASDRSR
jgi:CHAD domain-containing protein